jgi:hypothetical protein
LSLFSCVWTTDGLLNIGRVWPMSTIFDAIISTLRSVIIKRGSCPWEWWWQNSDITQIYKQEQRAAGVGLETHLLKPALFSYPVASRTTWFMDWAWQHPIKIIFSFHLTTILPGTLTSTQWLPLEAHTKVIGTYEGGRVLDCSAHLLSRSLVSRWASVACCTLSVSLCAPRAVVPSGQYKYVYRTVRWAISGSKIQLLYDATSTNTFIILFFLF